MGLLGGKQKKKSKDKNTQKNAKLKTPTTNLKPPAKKTVSQADLKKMISDAVEASIEKYMGQIISMLEDISAKSNPEQMKPLFNSLESHIINTMNENFSQIQEIKQKVANIESQLSAVIGALDNFTDKVQNSLFSIEESINNLDPEAINEKLNKSIDELSDTLLEKISDKLETIDDLKSKVTTLSDEIVVLTETLNGINDRLDENKNYMTELETLTSETLETVKSIKEDLSRIESPELSEDIKKILETVDEIKKTLEMVKEIEKIKKSLDEAEKKIKEIYEAIYG